MFNFFHTTRTESIWSYFHLHPSTPQAFDLTKISTTETIQPLPNPLYKLHAAKSQSFPSAFPTNPQFFHFTLTYHLPTIHFVFQTMNVTTYNNLQLQRNLFNIHFYDIHMFIEHALRKRNFQYQLRLVFTDSVQLSQFE